MANEQQQSERTYRVWVGGRKETTLEIVHAASAFIARRRLSERHGLKTYDVIAQHIASEPVA